MVNSLKRLVLMVLVGVWMWCSLPLTAIARTETASPTLDLQPYIDRVLDRISEFTLDNGMKFIVMERHQAPVVSFMTYVNVGAAYETEGKTGAAHFLEHLAFKGTHRIGTTNYDAEKRLFEQMDQVFGKLLDARAKQQESEVAQLQTEFDTLRQQAATYVKQNEFGQLVERSGGVGLNATTSADATRYFYSFPSNKLELWMSLESERFLEPVFREFYEEKDVILEERRMRTDNSPIGKMIEAFLEAAFPGHPYGRPVIGYAEDLATLTRKDIADFYNTYYTPNRMVMAVVGDVDTQAVKRMAETYFGRLNRESRAPDVVAEAPQQTAPREVVLNLQSEPWYLEGYQRPSLTDPTDEVYSVITSLLVGGRTSRLYQTLVETGLALSVDVANSFPGDRYPNAMLLYALTGPGHTIEEVATVLDRELERLKTEPVSVEELDRVKTQVRVGTLQTLSSNQGMASLLPEYEAKTGSWRNLFEDLKALEAVDAAQVQQVAQQTFVPEKLTVGRLLSTTTQP
ncbi:MULTISPECIES: pitrilysin family protein [unclassified Leptolyngbya]|uniref:M16 family metallopeptidase n=1 Tax=unclassified Leptolyngbya TaxID=2650499 RepID=UPI0016889F65|nr:MULTISPECIES: pitrilysin family protein [unclassified Leptolyngbya]MBD1913387.1 insulinase family protein [Leptolyngbya sp. FACHB-8]MBD2158682.1 insulinase family protein [Leptolyngbya sp. FACHB-16]